MSEDADDDDLLLDANLRRYGLGPDGDLLAEVRENLRERIAAEHREQGLGNTELMRLCCVQLFNAGDLEDVLLIWQAKTSSWDAQCSVDVQLLCGAGLPETKAFLAGRAHIEEAGEALTWVNECEAAGDFDGFSVQEYAEFQAAYYLGGPSDPGEGLS
ncbi:hypothetical protein [Actinomadura roseirufa]|uniref:hypothetical protein n=1 Tax=Actinomadura roseirufa TaxID=2094049 RepID=UPI001A9562AD|nr:hypothetical protein [Actinomadura roseirufa]